MLNLNQIVGNESGPLEGKPFYRQKKLLFTSEHISKTIEPVQQLKNQRYRKVGWKLFNEQTENWR